MSVELSADGNTAIVGGWQAEAALVFTRSGGAVWTQQGNKLVASLAARANVLGIEGALAKSGQTLRGDGNAKRHCPRRLFCSD